MQISSIVILNKVKDLLRIEKLTLVRVTDPSALPQDDDQLFCRQGFLGMTLMVGQ